MWRELWAPSERCLCTPQLCTNPHTLTHLRHLSYTLVHSEDDLQAEPSLRRFWKALGGSGRFWKVPWSENSREVGALSRSQSRLG